MSDSSGPGRSMLLVDDDQRLRDAFARDFKRRGIAVRAVGSVAQAAEAARTAPFDYAVVDMLLPDGDGFEVIEAILGAAPRTRVVVLTGYARIDHAFEAARLGAHDYLAKPVEPDAVLAALDGKPVDVGRANVAGPRAPSLHSAERDHIVRILGECRGNISEAARTLGIHRRTLQRKLKKQ